MRYYLGEEPVLANVDTWRLEDPDARELVLDRLDELVIKPVDGSGGKGIVIGPAATKSQLAKLRKRLIADPRGWIAQPVISLSTVPTVIGDQLAPRHVDLRPFAVNNGDEVWVLPGGLTRVALPEGELVVNSSQGGGSKDTWVLGDPDAPPPRTRRAATPSAEQSAMAGQDVNPDDDAGADQAQQQQQSQVLGSMRQSQVQSSGGLQQQSQQQSQQQGSPSC